MNCQYEFCAKEFTPRRYKKPGVQKFCSRRCKTLAWMVENRPRWNQIQKESNRRDRANWTEERRERHKAACARYNKDHQFELKVKAIIREEQNESSISFRS